MLVRFLTVNIACGSYLKNFRLILTPLFDDGIRMFWKSNYIIYILVDKKFKYTYPHNSQAIALRWYLRNDRFSSILLSWLFFPRKVFSVGSFQAINSRTHCALKYYKFIFNWQSKQYHFYINFLLYFEVKEEIDFCKPDLH